MKDKDWEITQEWIELAKKKKACSGAIRWLEKEPRTWEELKQHRTAWAAWAQVFIPEVSVDLEGLSSSDRAWVMINRKDYPIDLEGLPSRNKAWIMVNRKDCPLDYAGMSKHEIKQVKCVRRKKHWSTREGWEPKS